MLESDGCFISSSFAHNEWNREADGNGAGHLEFETRSSGSMIDPGAVRDLNNA